MKGLTVDLVVTGDESAAVAAAVDAVRRGQRVLVVLRSGGPRVVARLRRLCQAAKRPLTVMTNAEVVCVDGVGGVEAVVVRYTRTGRLCAVNTSAFLSCDGPTHPSRARMGDVVVLDGDVAGCSGRFPQLARPRSLTRSGFTRPRKIPTSRDLSFPRTGCRTR
jgi:thioredoxin reductase